MEYTGDVGFSSSRGPAGVLLCRLGSESPPSTNYSVTVTKSRLCSVCEKRPTPTRGPMMGDDVCSLRCARTRNLAALHALEARKARTSSSRLA